ncbi:MAG: HEAT repeat domain-containing protein [Pseudonocardiaceae bacterium]
MLSRVERATGNTTAAAQAARDAYLQAWCDGPPFSYAAGLDEARANLSTVGVPEPAGLDGFELGEPFPEVFIEPIPPDVSLASLRTGEAFSHSQITAMIEKLSWTAVDAAVTAELDAILGSEVAAPIRVAALRALARIEADAERSRERAQRAVQDQAEEVRAAALLLLDHQADLRGAPPPPIRVRRVAAASELSADVKSFLLERASSDLDMYVRATARFLIADSYPEFPPQVLLLDELVAAPASEREPLCIALRATGNLGRDPAVLAKLVMLLESEESDAVRIEFARWLSYSGHPDAEPALRGLLRAADSEVRRAALAVLARELDKQDRQLLTEHIDGDDPFLDPTEPITQTWMAEAAEKIGKPIDQVRRDYERLAAAFDLGDWITG